MADNKNVTYILGGVIAVLLALIAFIVYRNMTEIPKPTISATPSGTTAGTTGNTGGPAAAPVTFDPNTATKVSVGTTPEQFVKAYYEEVKAGKFAEAYKRLPLDKQEYYQDSAGFQKTLESYGITGYELEAAQTSGDQVSVVAWQQTPNGAFGYRWVLVKEGDGWLVQSRDQAGMK